MCEYLARLFDRCKTINTGCFIWQGCLTPDGYPRATYKGNENTRAHRTVFYLTYGYYPPVVRHKCDNPICMNPEHLLPGTNLDNIKDRNSRKRTGGHVFDTEIYWVKTLRKEGLTYAEIGKTLQMNPKRAEYINLKKGG